MKDYYARLESLGEMKMLDLSEVEKRFMALFNYPANQQTVANTMPDLEAIKARLAAATPGPWIYRNTCEILNPGRPVCEVEHVSVVPLADDVFVLPYGQDLELIVNAPRDLAALVTEVELLRETLGCMVEAWDLHDTDYARDPDGYERIESAAVVARKLLDA